MASPTLKTFINLRLLAILMLGFSSGLPFALIGSTLQVWFADANINLLAIGALSLLGLPYTLKFLWAPLMDYYRLERFGSRRAWILLAQFGLAVTLFLIAQMNPALQIKSMCLVAFLIAFFSASQDIAIDAYRADILLAEERGLGSAYFVFTYRLAALLSGGFALISADYFGWTFTYEMMGCLVLCCMIPTYFAPQSPKIKTVATNLFTMIKLGLMDLLQHDKVIFLILFILLYKLGAVFAVSLMSNFLLQGLGFSKTELGLVYKTVSFTATVLGTFLGGVLLIRWNIYKALFAFGLSQIFSNVILVLLAITGKNYALMTAAVFIENFCSGMATAAFLAFLMSLCHHRYTATQFALLSALDSLARIFLGPAAGVIADQWGWTQFYLCSVILCFPGLIFLTFLKDRISSYAAPAAAD